MHIPPKALNPLIMSTRPLLRPLPLFSTMCCATAIFSSPWSDVLLMEDDNYEQHLGKAHNYTVMERLLGVHIDCYSMLSLSTFTQSNKKIINFHHLLQSGRAGPVPISDVGPLQFRTYISFSDVCLRCTSQFYFDTDGLPYARLTHRFNRIYLHLF